MTPRLNSSGLGKWWIMPISIGPGCLELKLHEKQRAVLDCRANELFWGGEAGSGKSFLVRALAIILCVEVPRLSAFLFRRTFREILDVHMAGPASFPAMLAGMASEGLVKVARTQIKFANGSRITLAHCANASDGLRSQGAESGPLGLDE